MTEEVRKTTRRLVISLVGMAVLAAGITLLIMQPWRGWEKVHTQVLLGFVAGAALGSFMAVHMAVSLSKSVELGEAGALQHTRKTYMIRTVLVMAAVVLLFLTGWFHILALLAGIFCLKPAAYLQLFFCEKDGEPTAVADDDYRIEEEER